MKRAAEPGLDPQASPASESAVLASPADSVRSALTLLVNQFACNLALSPREAEVLRLAAQGRSMKEAAAALSISPKTVEDYWSRIYVKTGRSSQLAVVSRLIDWLGLCIATTSVACEPAPQGAALPGLARQDADEPTPYQGPSAD